MLVMKVVDKEFLFPSTLLLFWNCSPKRKVQYLLLYSFSATMASTTLVHSHMKFTSNDNRYIRGPEPVVCATSLSLPLKEKLPCSGK